MGEKNLYKTITETVPEFFFVYDLAKKKITFLSPRFFEIAGGSPSSLKAQGLRSYIHPEDESTFDNFFDNLSAENNFTNRIELRTNQELGGIRWVEINTFPVEDDESSVKEVVGHIVDITDKKERISLLEREQQKLDSVLKILAHDLRTPFGQVYMIADILKEMMDEKDLERYGIYIGMLKNLGNRSLNLLDNLLRLVALQEGTLSLDLKKHDLQKLIENMVEAYEINLSEKKINWEVEGPGFAVVAEVDGLLLEQALSNLLSNALKFTPPGGNIWLRIAKKDNKAIIEIEDSGIGIPENHIPDLFKEFSKIRRKGLKGEKSTGLGLAICKQIIKLHKGRISVKSQENKGTRFTVTLPLGTY